MNKKLILISSSVFIVYSILSAWIFVPASGFVDDYCDYIELILGPKSSSGEYFIGKLLLFSPFILLLIIEILVYRNARERKLAHVWASTSLSLAIIILAGFILRLTTCFSLF